MEQFFTSIENHENIATSIALFILLCLWSIGDWFKKEKK